MLKDFLVAVAVAPTPGAAGRIEVHEVLADSAEQAKAACTEAARGAVARQAALLEGELLALWNELGKAAFGFGR